MSWILGLEFRPLTGALHTAWVVTGWVLLGWGLWWFWWAVIIFMRAGQTLEPKDTPDRLVTWGPFRFCSSPMFYGVFCILFGEGFLLHPVVFIEAIAFTVVIRAWYLPKREEPKLRLLFGQEWVSYCRSVWHGVLPVGLIARRYRYPRRVGTA